MFMADAPKLQGTEKVGESYYKINMSIDNANEALRKSYKAEEKSVAAEEKSNAADALSKSIQKQLDEVVVEGSIDPETKQIRVDAHGVVYDTAKQRIDAEQNKIVNLNNSTKNRKVLDLGLYKGTTTTDMVDLITQRILEGYTKFLIPPNIRFNKTLEIKNIRSEGIVFEGSGVSYDNALGKSSIELNTGGVGIRISGSNFVTFKNISLSSMGLPNPSTVGIVQQRSLENDFNQWNFFEDVYIDMHTDYNANGGKGTIGLYNHTAEITTYHNLTIRADLPCVVTKGNLYGISTVQRAYSMKTVAFSGMTTLIASKSHALVLEGISSMTFENLHPTKDAFRASNTEKYGILIAGMASGGFENYGLQINSVDCEEFSSLMKIESKLRASRIHGNHHMTKDDNRIINVGAEGYMISCEIKLICNLPSNIDKDLVYFEPESGGAFRSTFHFVGSDFRITTYKPLTACIVHSQGLPKIVKNHSFAQSVYSMSEKGFGINDRFINMAYSRPNTVDMAGSITFNTNTALGTNVGWIYDGVDHKPFGQIGVRQISAPPTLTPNFIGEEVLDVPNKKWYKSTGTTSSDWVALN